MSKVLLVYDDFSELTAVELSLKKIGFDVIGLTNEFTIKDQIVSFNPDVLVTSGSSSRVSTNSVAKKIKEMTRWLGKSVLIFPEDYKIPPEDLLKLRMDIMLVSPVPLTRLIQVVAKFSGQDEHMVIEKLIKSFADEKVEIKDGYGTDDQTQKAMLLIEGEIKSLQENQFVKQGNREKKEILTNIKENSYTKNDNSKNDYSNSDNSNNSNLKNEDPFNELIDELSGKEKSINKSERTASDKPTLKVVDDEKANDRESKDDDRFAEAIASIDNKGVDNESLKVQIKSELLEQNNKMQEKLKRYNKLANKDFLYPESMMKRVNVRREFHVIKKDWDNKQLENIDRSRQEFVKALFRNN